MEMGPVTLSAAGDEKRMVRLLKSLLIPATRLGAIPIDAQPEPEALHIHFNCLAIPWATGLHDGRGRPLLDTFLQRGSRERPDFPHGMPKNCDPPHPPTAPGRGADILFVPWCDVSHFGHLLTETAAWLWPLLDPLSSPLNWPGWRMTILVGRFPGSDDPVPTLSRVLKLPPERIRTTDTLVRPLHCARAVIPVPSMVNRRGIARHHLDAARRLIDLVYDLSPAESLECLSEAATYRGNAKLYLSRSRLSSALRAIRGEQALEARLMRLGWQIVHPEQLPMVEQLRALAGAQVIAGELGSSLHLLMYFGSCLTHRTVIGLGVIGTRRDPRTVNILEQLRLQSVHVQVLHCLGFCQPRRIGAGRPGSEVIHDRRLLMPAPWVAERLDRLAADAESGAARSDEIW